MPIKKLGETLRFLESLYKDHQPTEYGSCGGNHETSGFQEESPEWPCYFHQTAADLLGLPEVEYVDTRAPRVLTPLSKSIQAVWQPVVEEQLKPTPDQLQLQAQYDLAHWNPDGA